MAAQRPEKCSCVYPPDWVSVCQLHPWGHSDVPGVAHLPEISPLLYVGNKRAAASRPYDVVVSTTVPVDASGAVDAPELSTHILLYEDTEDASYMDTARRQIAEGAAHVEAAVATGKTVLVHCEWGQNRSCSICCAYAVLSKGWTAAAAVAYCRERNQADRAYRGQAPPTGGAMHNKKFVGLVEELEEGRRRRRQQEEDEKEQQEQGEAATVLQPGAAKAKEEEANSKKAGSPTT